MHGCKTFEIDSNHHLMEVHDDIQKESTFFLFRKKNLQQIMNTKCRLFKSIVTVN